MAKKPKINYFCTDCGTEAVVWMGRCPGCQNYGTMVEGLDKKVKKNTNRQIAPMRSEIQVLKDIPKHEENRMHTSMGEFNLVVGGGLVRGSLTLLGGEPGIGKSTLLLQVAAEFAQSGKKVLYVSGEESPYQVKLRAERLQVSTADLLFFAETDVDVIVDEVKRMQPDFLIIDSIQTVYLEAIQSAPGSVTQIRECTAQFMRLAKQLNVTIFLVGHVTKDGAIAGPKILEHMVDTVLYFEGEQQNSFRILRTVKNRFGSTNEIGVFDMRAEGLVEVTNPSELFLEKRDQNYSGICVCATLEGTRPLLIEIQSLLSPTYFGNPRRTSTGVEHNRLALILAVLEKRAGILLQNQDVFLKVVAGMRIDDPAADLAIATCIASGNLERAIPLGVVMIGEVGLTGEIRRVTRLEERVSECLKLGFKQVFVPKGISKQLAKHSEVIEVATIRDALSTLDLIRK
ncbi:DNA repair protein [Erysipelotrichaceae bacterium]|nr:DNA repair protein [Erysipelotrichaceae bacterium]